MDAIRREWDELAFTTMRQTQLVALLGVVAVLALTFYGWQRGVFSTMAAEISGGRVVADGTPSAPRLSSDQVAWTDEVDDDSRRSTASFASDRAFADESDHAEPTSGAKLFVADGKKSSKASASSLPEGDSSGDAGRRSSREVESGVGSKDTQEIDTRAQKRTGTTLAPVRYETCAEAAAAGAAPIRLGEPGYRLSLDADKDGVACETGSTPEDPGDGPVDSLYANPTTTSTADDAGSTTTASTTGAGTTSTSESTTTSTPSTSWSPTTTGGSGSTQSTMTTSTPSTTTSTTSPTTSTSSTTTTTSTTSTTATTASTTATSTTTTTVPSTPSTTLTPSTTDVPPTIDPIRIR